VTAASKTVHRPSRGLDDAAAIAAIKGLGRRSAEIDLLPRLHHLDGDAGRLTAVPADAP
jgi:hypothetical protein